jgi:hypothetical protein
MPSLRASRSGAMSSSAGILSSVARALDRATWIDLACDTLDVSDAPRAVEPHAVVDVKQRRGDLLRDGCALMSRKELLGDDDDGDLELDALLQTMYAIRDAGLDPTWVYMYDATWRVVERFRASLEDECFGGATTLNFDVLAWFVDPTHDEKTTAFTPHRDRQPDDAPGSFHADGMAKYCTIWLPLTNATPRNSCLYCVPKGIDPGYTAGDSDDLDGPSPLEIALKDKAAYQSVRALPVERGGAVCFTHRLIHWGSVGDGGRDGPRINLSFGFADPEFEPAYLLNARRGTIPTVAERAGLIAGQMISYHERFPPSKAELRVLKQIFDNVKSSFHETYVKKVNFEFTNATLRGDAESDDEGVENALDAMLDNASDFEDDFEDEGSVGGDSDDEVGAKKRKR